VTGKLYCLFGVLALSLTVAAQTTTTNCNTNGSVYGGNINANTSCTTTSNEPTAQQLQQQAQLNQSMNNLGAAIGARMAYNRQIKNSKKNYCKVHPDESGVHNPDYSVVFNCVNGKLAK
jgi:hypothetical protein